VTTKASRTAAPQAAPPTIESLVRFTPEEAFAKKLTTYKPSTLRKRAQEYRIPHHREGGVPGGRIYFTLADLAAITDAERITPLALA